MSQHRPAIDNLLATVREFLEATAPTLAGEARYKLQVAAYLVGICERELALVPGQAEGERAAFARLLDRSIDGKVDLAPDLCAAIRRGELDGRFDEAVETVLARLVEDVRVVKPSHLDRSG